jgi:hypothetical protein
VLPIHPACDALPLMSPEELRELADDIKKNGLRHKIDLRCYADGNEYVLDAMELLGWNLLTANGQLDHKYQRQTLGAPGALAAPPAVRAWVISTNIRRRHLNQEQKREMLAKLLKADPSKSNGG